MKNLKQIVKNTGLVVGGCALTLLAQNVYSTFAGPKDHIVSVRQYQNGDIGVTLSNDKSIEIGGRKIRKVKHIDFEHDPTYGPLDYGLIQRLKEANIKVYTRK
ncbi:hypothetical protein KY348_04990 [Candidatus Woesearchaeota archaeon]|nr:hypothetical protein [Candidatus Woesearchaeota archaeon]